MKRFLIRLCWTALAIFFVAISYLAVKDTIAFHSSTPALSVTVPVKDTVRKIDTVQIQQKKDTHDSVVAAIDSEARVEIKHRAKSQNGLNGKRKHHRKHHKH